jgi:hypothetical protein
MSPISSARLKQSHEPMGSARPLWMAQSDQCSDIPSRLSRSPAHRPGFFACVVSFGFPLGLPNFISDWLVPHHARAA